MYCITRGQIICWLDSSKTTKRTGIERNEMDARRPTFQSPHTLTSSRDDRVAIREAGKMPAIEDKCLLFRKGRCRSSWITFATCRRKCSRVFCLEQILCINLGIPVFVCFSFFAFPSKRTCIDRPLFTVL